MPEKVFDGFTSLQGGMNGGTQPALLSANQFYKGVNITCRNGTVDTRPPFIEIELESDIVGAVENIQNGKFQGQITYENSGRTYIAFAFSGQVYLLDPLTNTIYDMTLLPGRFNQYVHRLHFAQVDRFLVVQDGFNPALIIEGTSSRKAVLGDNEVPIGTVMAYCQGRLFIKTDERAFIAGNIFKQTAPTDVLVFTETQYLAGGGAFYPPADFGEIVAMTWAQSYGTATGEGPLLVLCERGIASFNVSVPRLQWQDLSIMRAEPAGTGCASEFCAVNMNEDLVFMSWNGIQDFKLLNTEVSSQHRITNMNTEVQPFIDQETPWLRPFTSGVKFDDRFLYTSIGERVWAKDDGGNPVEDYRFKGLISLDFAPQNGISSLGENMRPAYDGIWTGNHPMGIAVGIFNFVERCFVFGKDDDGINHLYELMKKPGNDNGAIPIETKLYTRAMPFIAYDREYPRPVPFMQKDLIDAQLWIDSFRYSVEFNLAVCPDNTIHYHELSTISVRSPLISDIAPFVSGAPQSRPHESFPAFTEAECEMISGRNATTGFEIQFLISWAGVAKISRFDIMAHATRVKGNLECAQNTKLLTGVPADDFSYDMENAS